MSHVQMPENRRKRSDRRSSGLYLPAWSVGVMLLIVIAIVVALVTLLITLGGGTPAAGEPRVVIITAVPTETPLPSLATVTSNPTTIPQAGGGTSIPVPEFALEGPTLAPIVFTPTPLSIAVGVTVRIDADGLNIREAPGLDQTILFQAEQDSVFRVISGPQQASDITWWQIEDPTDPTRSGWAAADYLIAQP